MKGLPPITTILVGFFLLLLGAVLAWLAGAASYPVHISAEFSIVHRFGGGIIHGSGWSGIVCPVEPEQATLTTGWFFFYKNTRFLYRYAQVENGYLV